MGLGNEECLLNGYGSLWSDDNVLEMDSDGGSCITL